MFSIIEKKPYWIQNKANSGEWELCGPFFSISAIKNPNNKYSIILDIDLEIDISETNMLKTVYLTEDATESEIIAKNLCIIYYNEALSKMIKADKNEE